MDEELNWDSRGTKACMELQVGWYIDGKRETGERFPLVPFRNGTDQLPMLSQHLAHILHFLDAPTQNPHACTPPATILPQRSPP